MINNNFLFVLTNSSPVILAFPTEAGKPLCCLPTEHYTRERLGACKVVGLIKRLALVMLLELGSLRIRA